MFDVGMEHGGAHPSPTTPAPASTGILSQFAALQGIPLGVPASTQSDNPLIYMGSPKVPNPAGLLASGDNKFNVLVSQIENTTTHDELLTEFDSMSAEKQRKWALWLTLAGYSGSVDLDKVDDAAAQMSLGELLAAYSNLLGDAENRYGVGQKITPTQLLKKAIDYRLDQAGVKWDGKLGSLDTSKLTSLFSEAGIGAESLSPYANATITTTSKSVDFLNPMDAKNLVRGMLQQQLGRDPSQAEYEDFLGAVHAAEQDNPSTTKTTTKYDENGAPMDTSSVTHGGMSAGAYEQLAYDRATRNPDWAEWQAMGTYAPALFSALNAPIPGV